MSVSCFVDMITDFHFRLLFCSGAQCGSNLRHFPIFNTLTHYLTIVVLLIAASTLVATIAQMRQTFGANMIITKALFQENPDLVKQFAGIVDFCLYVFFLIYMSIVLILVNVIP